MHSKTTRSGYDIFTCIPLIFWHSKQEMCIKWGQTTADYFTISNGVRQGSILSPRLFAVYVDDLSKQLIDTRSGCFVEHQCINHVMYVDDICLLAPIVH